MESESIPARAVAETPVAEPPDAAFMALHAERETVERDLALAQQRQRFGVDPADVAQAGADEGALLAALDRVLTQIRAAEYRRSPGARRW